MSYSIIFETKIVKLSDGRIIHFDLSGCNNDNSGRDRHEFHAKIYTVEDFIKYAEHFEENSKPHKESDGFDLKIGSRYATMYDYGEHLLRMLKRAETYADFLTKRYSSAEYCIGIELYKPERKTMTLEEFDKVFYKLLYGEGGLSYSRVMEYPDMRNEAEIVKLIEDKKPIQFYIGKVR